MQSTPSTSVAALTALYQAERADNASMFNTILAMLAAGLAYFAGTLALSNNFGSLGTVAVAVLPAPLWVVTAFHAVLFGAASKRTRSALRLEDKLYELTGMDKVDRDSIGSAAGERVHNIKIAPLAYKIVLVIAYGGSNMLIIMYTAYALVYVARISMGGLAVALVVYVAILAAVGYAWIYNIRHVSD
jgi:hypothetical protein